MAGPDAIGKVEGSSASRVDRVKLFSNYYNEIAANVYQNHSNPVSRDIAIAFVGTGDLGLYNNDYYYGPGEGNYNFGPKNNIGWQTNENGYTEEIPIDKQWIC